MMFDIFFLSYNESSANENWQSLQTRFPQAKRVHGIKGIQRAHQAIAEKSESEFFFVIDGDNKIIENFDFQIDFKPKKGTVYVWRCKNPVNDLVYGYGGVKLYNKSILLKDNPQHLIDVATTVASKYQPIEALASITHFNTSELEAWRAGFREAVKLQLNILNNPNDIASQQRLEIWCQKGNDRPFGNWCLNGANLGRNFAKTYQADHTKLKQINNFEWLQEQFYQLITTNPS